MLNIDNNAIIVYVDSNMVVFMYGSMIQNVADKYISSWEKTKYIFLSYKSSKFTTRQSTSLGLDKLNLTSRKKVKHLQTSSY